MLRDVEEEIRHRIAAKGRITFAEFMELALFWPRGGYYSSPNRIGAKGDFYTAPGAHPAFGALLSLQLYQMWQLLGEPDPFWAVEVGAGNALLCQEVLDYSSHLPGRFPRHIRYVCVDRWPVQGHEQWLTRELLSRVSRLAAVGLPLRGFTGCLISNELVDSFPVHRVAMKDGSLREIYVTLSGEKLTEVIDEPSTPLLQKRFEKLGVSLAEGYRTEVSLALEPWMAEVAGALHRGFVLTIDYGYPAPELYSPERSRGTLSCYYKHIQVGDPYCYIGQQDITAHVDFTSLADTGQAQGLEPLGISTQRRFLTSLGLSRWLESLTSLGLSQRETEANRLGMLELARPGGMGDFLALVQGKGVGNLGHQLWGLQEGGPPVLEALTVPLLKPVHMPLLQGQYPHRAVEWGKL